MALDFPTDVSATDPDVLLGANATDPAKVLISATGRTLVGGANAAAMRTTLGLGTAATQASSAFDAAGAAAAAEAAAIITAAGDATSKANTAQANAIAAAALDATSKANTAQANAISTAAGDATSKANTAQANAIAAAALDATSKANAAQAAAIAVSAQRASNLSDLADPAAARANLSIYTTLTAGGLTVPTVTVGATGLLNAGLLTANLNSTPDYTGVVKTYQVPALSPAIQLTANTLYYLTVIYNGGTPVYSLITDNTIINHSDRISVALVFWENVGAINHGHVWMVGAYGVGLSNKLSHRLIHTQRFGWESGLQLGESTGRVITVSAGTVWYDGTEILLDSINSTSHPYHLYYHSAGNWVATEVTAYNNTQWDDGTTLQTTGNGNFVVNWVYRSVAPADPGLYVVLGTANYTNLTVAGASQPPASLPGIISKMAVLVGRIIVQKNAVTAAQIDSAFAITFAGTGTISHGDTINRDALGSHPHYAIAMATRTVTGNDTITTADYYIRYAGAGGHTLTIPAANVAGAGFTPQFFFRNISGASVNITDGVSTVTLLPGQKALFMSDGVSSWDVN